MAIKHPDRDLKAFLRSNMDFSGIRATIDSSSVDLPDPEGDRPFPKFVVQGPSVTPLSAGSRPSGNVDTTGWTGTTGDGSGPMQTTFASVQVSAFAGTEESPALSAHPYDVVEDMLDEVTDAVRAAPGGPSGYQSMGYSGGGSIPEDDEDPPVYGEYRIIAMTYHDMP